MKDDQPSFHWLVLEWACVPEARAAWHVQKKCSHLDVNGGIKRVNHWSLGIEIVNLQKNHDQFSNWQVEVTAQIIRYCWAKYPNLKHIVAHAKLDPARRNDPGPEFPWEKFKNLVLSSTERDGLPGTLGLVTTV